jgi:hypothetical protein
MPIHRVAMALAAVVLLVDTGCALRFEGELDGEPIPTFSTGAFAVLDAGGTAASVVALATPGDSCAEATAYAALRVDNAEATTPERQIEVADALVAWSGRVLPEGAWLVQLQVDSVGRALLRDVSVDLGSNDNDADVALSLCRSEGDPAPTAVPSSPTSTAHGPARAPSRSRWTRRRAPSVCRRPTTA